MKLSSFSVGGRLWGTEALVFVASGETRVESGQDEDGVEAGEDGRRLVVRRARRGRLTEELNDMEEEELNSEEWTGSER